MKRQYIWAMVALMGSTLSLTAQNKPEIKANSETAVGCVQRVGEGFVLMSADGNLELLGGENLAGHVGKTVKVTGRRGQGDVTIQTIETVRGDCDEADRAAQKAAERNQSAAANQRDRGEANRVGQTPAERNKNAAADKRDHNEADRAGKKSVERGERAKADKRDRGVTADDQGGSKADRETTAKIRRSLVDDDSLSTMAHNVKIITRDGQVTLRGKVESEAEKSAVLAKAKSVLGDADIHDEMTVKNERKAGNTKQ